jgi:hypothetical protein
MLQQCHQCAIFKACASVLLMYITLSLKLIMLYWSCIKGAVLLQATAHLAIASPYLRIADHRCLRPNACVHVEQVTICLLCSAKTMPDQMSYHQHGPGFCRLRAHCWAIARGNGKC